MLKLPLLASALLSASLLGGCGESCNDIGCGTPLALTLSKPTPIPPAGLTVKVDADGMTSSCTVIGEASTCTSPSLKLIVQAGALQQITLESAPQQVKVEISTTTAVLSSETVRPTYSMVDLGGPVCDGPCRQGVANLSG